jgi:hypothetical protein
MIGILSAADLSGLRQNLLNAVFARKSQMKSIRRQQNYINKTTLLGGFFVHIKKD